MNREMEVSRSMFLRVRANLSSICVAIIILAFSFFIPGSLFCQCNDDEIFKQLRNAMVQEQIISRGITDSAVISAMLDVPRHCFVPSGYRNEAYADYPLPIGQGQTISQPYIVAFMTEQANLNKEHRVLEIGTGSGYQAAILAEIVDSVFTIEIIPDLAEEASLRLKSMGYGNIRVKTGDGYFGWEEKAPFDAILVTAGADEIPQPLIDQLKEGGRMVIPVGDPWLVQSLELIIKRNNQIERKFLLPVRFVPLTGKH